MMPYKRDYKKDYASDMRNTRYFGLKISYSPDRDLIEHLESRPEGVNAYLKALIRADMEKKAEKERPED